jgi:hypothetical protein
VYVAVGHVPCVYDYVGVGCVSEWMSMLMLAVCLSGCVSCCWLCARVNEKVAVGHVPE